MLQHLHAQALQHQAQATIVVIELTSLQAQANLTLSIIPQLKL
jgi:hypothetical protein